MTHRDPETGIGGGDGRFPETRYTTIAALRSGDTSKINPAWESLVQMYWRPVYKHLRLKWHKSNEDAKDLTQGFFATAIEKQFFKTYDPSRSRFRTFLRTCLDGYVQNEDKAARTQKRGGDAQFVSFDFHQAEIELQQSKYSPDEVFEKEWIRSLFSNSLDDFRKSCETRGKMIPYQIFEKYDVETDPDSKVSYADLSQEFGIPVTSVTNHLAFARREFRKIVLLKLQEMSGNEDEYRNDARRLFGVKFG